MEPSALKVMKKKVGDGDNVGINEENKKSWGKDGICQSLAVNREFPTTLHKNFW